MSRGFGAVYGVNTSDYVRTGLLTSGSDRRSYFIWAYRHGVGGNNSGLIFSKNTPEGATASELFYWDNTFGCLKYDRSNASNVQTSRTRLILSGVSGLADIWFSLLLTHDQSSGALTSPFLYYNGVVNNSQQVTTGFTATSNNTDPYLIGNGKQPTSFPQAWDGFLAHFTVWDNVILGQYEALALHSGVHPMSIAPVNCVSYFPLDGIHNPEVNFYPGSPHATVSGSRFGVLQPPRVPMYIASRNRPREAAFWQAAAAAAVPAPQQQYGVSVIT